MGTGIFYSRLIYGIILCQQRLYVHVQLAYKVYIYTVCILYKCIDGFEALFDPRSTNGIWAQQWKTNPYKYFPVFY